MVSDKEILDIKKSLARIETAVVGDEKAGIPGLAKRTHDLEEYKKSDEKMKYRVAGGLFVSVPILGAIWKYIETHWIQ